LVILLGFVYFVYFGDTSTNSGGGSNAPTEPHQIETINNEGSGSTPRTRTGDDSRLKLRKATIRSIRASEAAGAKVMTNILDALDPSNQDDGPPSPTGSDDSSETIRPSPSPVKGQQIKIFLGNSNK